MGSVLWELTLNLKGPMGGFAYGILVKPLIVRPPNDRRYLPTNLLPFGNVTRNSSEIKDETYPVQPMAIKRITTVRWNILQLHQKKKKI